MTITPGELRARLQPIELLKIEKPVPLLDGTEALEPGTVVFAQYIGNGNVILTPITGNVRGVVAKAGVVNGVASIVTTQERESLNAKPKPVVQSPWIFDGRERYF